MTMHLKKIPLSLIAILFHLVSNGQTNYPPKGKSANLCPKIVTYRYNSPSSVNDIPCDQYGWDATNGKVVNSGVNTDGTRWADVVWDNEASGKLGNFCGVLDVTIAKIAQASISGPSTLLLCGSGTITLNATVSSTDNIVGYTWQISGTGVNPKGTVNTTSPQLNLSYSNWTPGSSLSATVAVGAISSCGYSTPIGPLEDFEGTKAIPRAAWVQLSPGNINDLLIPLNFNKSAICTNGIISISNKPSTAILSWSSGNTSALQLTTNDAASVIATRINNSNEVVNVIATLTNNCGSSSQTVQVSVGSPTPSLININGSTCPEYYFEASSIPSATSYFWQWSKDPYGPLHTKTTPSPYSGKITLVDGSGNYRIGVKATTCGQSDFAVQTFTMSGGGKLKAAI